MSREPNLTYLGVAPKADAPEAPDLGARLRALPWPFLVVVVLPTLITALYFLLIAAPQYVSEAKFIVRSAERSQPTGLGAVLQNVGLSAAQSDAFAVHEYLTSRDAISQLPANLDLAAILNRPESDFLSRFPKFWENRSDEDLHRAFQRFLTVGYNSSTGISTVRVRAFRPRDAQALDDALLAGGENLVNRLNQRAAGNAVSDAQRIVTEAELRFGEAQGRLTSFRNREGILDPQASAREGAEIVTGLAAKLATLRAERSEMAATAPASPQLPVMDGQIRAFENQLAIERAKMVGGAGSLAPKIETYEALTLDRDLADKGLASSRTALDLARQDAKRQQLYLERVVNPNLPDKSVEPRRWRAIFLVLVTTLMIYGLGWLVLAGVREHGQG